MVGDEIDFFFFLISWIYRIIYCMQLLANFTYFKKKKQLISVEFDLRLIKFMNF